VTISLDGYAAARTSDWTPRSATGVGWGDDLHSWFISATEDSAAGKTGIDVGYFVRGEQNIGATIMGRNMFGPQRGRGRTSPGRAGGATTALPPRRLCAHPPPAPGAGDGWRNHLPLHRRVAGDGAPARVRRADGKDVRSRRAAIIQQYLRAGLIDELHLVIAPMLIGAGSGCSTTWATGSMGTGVSELVGSPNVTHAVLVRR